MTSNRQAIDPRDANGPDDWRLTSYEGVLPGFDCKLFIPENHELWIEHLRANGFDLPMDAQHALRTEPDRPEQFGLSTFLTDHLLNWMRKQDGPWFAHASYLRPHPPFAAAGKWSKAYDPADVELPIAPGNPVGPLANAAVFNQHAGELAVGVSRTPYQHVLGHLQGCTCVS